MCERYVVKPKVCYFIYSRWLLFMSAFDYIYNFFYCNIFLDLSFIIFLRFFYIFNSPWFFISHDSLFYSKIVSFVQSWGFLSDFRWLLINFFISSKVKGCFYSVFFYYFWILNFHFGCLKLFYLFVRVTGLL